MNIILDNWKEQYNSTRNQITLVGWSFENAAECQAYFANRVKAKIQESDATTLLEEYLIEMSDTGFDISALQNQIQEPPKARDWEVGEAFAEAMLEDHFEASFPWPTSWDKRTCKASLPGTDLPGFHRRIHPQFLFGEVKSSSEKKSPPQVVNSGDDCLYRQISKLLTSSEHRQQLIAWLLVRSRDSKNWKPIFDEALNRYANGEAYICGVLVRGGTTITEDDLSVLQDSLKAMIGTFNVYLFAFYLPFDKSKWIDLVYGKESLQ